MQWQLLFFSMAPVLAFAAVEARGGQRNAVLVALAVAAVECVYNSLVLGFVEVFSATSFALFAVLGAVALRRSRMVVFKFQPVVMGLVWAGSFWIHDLTLLADDPLLVRILTEHVQLNEVLPPYQKGYFASYARTLSTSLPFLLVIHAAWTAWAAVRLSTWGWCLVRVLGFYGSVAVLFYAERLFRVTY